MAPLSFWANLFRSKNFVFLTLIFSSLAFGQHYDQLHVTNLKVGNRTTQAASAYLDVESTTKGVLLPRMTTTQRNAISSPATGLLIYNTTTSLFESYSGSAWGAVGGNPIITNDNSTNASVYPLWVNGTSGALAQSVSSTGFSFNPSTGVLSSSFVGNLTGNASGTSATFTGNLTGDVTSTGMATTMASTISGAKTFSTSLKSLAFISSTSNPASSGTIELADTDAIAWRNHANNANLSLAKSTTDQLTYGGTALFSSSGVQQAACFPALTGDVTTSGGSLATTLAATTNSTLATLSGLTSASSLATVGTIGTGTWQGTTVGTGFGGTGKTSVTTAPAASSWAGWDSNKNLSANNFLDGYATQALSGTTNLAASSARVQYFTGSSTGTVALPQTSTLAVGESFYLINRSTSTTGMNVNTFSGTATLQPNVPPFSYLKATVISIASDAAASWDVSEYGSYNAQFPNELISNLTFRATVSSNNLTVAFWNWNSQLSGFGNNFNGYVSFQGSSSINNGTAFGYVTGGTSVTGNSGATLGCVSGVACYTYVYAVNNGGTAVVGLSGSGNIDESVAQNTTAISSSATSATTLYTSAGLSGVFVRLIGRITSTEATAGTWASSVSATYFGTRALAIQKAMFQAKGDIAVASAAGTVTSQAVGPDGSVLIADSSQTNGVRYATLTQGAKNYITYNNFENNATTGWSLVDIPLTNAFPSVATTSGTALAAISINGDLTNGSACIANPTSLAGLTVGMKVGDGNFRIAFGTTIAGLPGSCSAGQIQMSANAGATHASSGINFNTPSADQGTAPILSNISSGQLAGTYSMRFSQATGTVAGNMMLSQAYTIDKEDQAKVLGFRSYYTVSTGASINNFSGTSSNSFGVAIYDVTNAQWIMPAGVWGMVQSSGVGYVTGTFQTPSNMTQFQFALFVANVSGVGTTNLDVDDFFVGPQITPMGPAMSDYGNTPWTPTGSWSTNTTYTGVWSRVGDKAHFSINLALAGAPTSAALTINLPAGLTIDTSKMPGFAAGTTKAGTINISAAAAQYVGDVRYNSTTSVALRYYNSASAGSPVTTANVTQAAPNTFANADFINGTFVLPIVGWSSNTASSADTDTRVVQFTGNSGSASLSSSYSDVTLTSVNDTHSAFNGTTTYTIPVTGYYKILAQARFSSSGSITATNAIGLQITKNGSALYPVNDIFLSANAQWVTLPYGDKFVAGDTIKLQAKNQNTNPTFSTTPTLYIARESGPAVVQATETVLASYQMAGSQSLTSTGIFKYDTKVLDTHNAYNTSTGIFTAPVAGKYQASFQVFSITASSGQFQLTLRKNSNGIVRCEPTPVAAGGSSLTANQMTCPLAPFIVQLNAGDTLDIDVSQAATTAASYASTTDNYMQIVRIGN